MRAPAWLLSLLLALAGVGVLHGVYAPAASACSCAAIPSDEELVDSVDVIARVKVKASGGQVGQFGEVAYTADVQEIWKGDPPTIITVLTAPDEAACGLGELAPGQELLLWGMVSSEEAYSTNICAQPQDREAALALVAETYGEARQATREPSVAVEEPGVGAGPWVAAGVVIVVAAAGAWWASRRREK